jgi:hypothetical protein
MNIDRDRFYFIFLHLFFIYKIRKNIAAELQTLGK